MTFKICWADIEHKDFMYKAFYEPCIENGYEIVDYCDSSCDIIFNAAIDCQRTFHYSNKFPNIPIITYCWDYYAWNVDPKSSYYYDKVYKKSIGYFNSLMKKSWKIFTPNKGTSDRIKEYLGLNSDILYVHIPTYDHDIKNTGYIYDPLRLYPVFKNGYGEPTILPSKDGFIDNYNAKLSPNCRSFVKPWSLMAAKELDIPYVRTDHFLSEEDFRKTVSYSNLIVSTYYEASTGGMTLVEGLWNGKRSLVSNSPYMGANEYLGPYGSYFQHDSYEDFKEKMFNLWTDYKEFPINSVRSYINSKFSKQAFFNNLSYHLSNQNKSMYKKLSIYDLINKLQNNEYFSFARYGDGELNCLWDLWSIGNGKNCDGCKYTEDLKNGLLQTFSHINDESFIYGLQDVHVKYRNGIKSDQLLNKVNWHDSEFLTDALRSGQLSPLFEQLSKMNVVLVGNEDKASFNRFKFHHIKIPKNNSFERIDEIENEILDYGQEGVYLFTAGMTSNVLISRLHHIMKNCFLLDIGHILDIFCGVASRNYHQEITQEIIDKNLM